MQEADLSRKTLIQKIADFLQKVLPCHTDNSKAVPQNFETPDIIAGPISEAHDRSLPFMSRAHEGVFETPIKRSLSVDTDEEEEGARYVPGETVVKEFSTKHFGTVASPYISAYVYRRGNLDRDSGIRRDTNGQFRIGKAIVDIDQDSNVFVLGKSYKGTRGLFELLTRKKVDHSFITDKDLKSYKKILEATHCHLENYDSSGIIKTTRGVKFKEVISKLFPGGVR